MKIYVCILLSCLVCIVVAVPLTSYAEDKDIISVIESHIERRYVGIYTNRHTLNAESDKVNKLMQKSGLITYKTLKIDFINFMEVNLTEYGKKQKPITIYPEDDENKRVAFYVADRKVLEIVDKEQSKLDKNAKIVYFTFSESPNDLGKKIYGGLLGPYRYRGKAVVFFDVFQSEYLFKGFIYGAMTKDDYVPGSWVDYKGEKKICKYGIYGYYW